MNHSNVDFNGRGERVWDFAAGAEFRNTSQAVTFRKACTKRPLHLWLFSSLEKSYVCWGCIAVAAPGVAVIRAELSASAPDR